MSFSSQIEAYRRVLENDLKNKNTKICTEMATDIIKRTPIDTGQARGNWVAGVRMTQAITIPDLSTTTNRREGEAIQSARMHAEDSLGKVFTYTNSLPYIIPLEFGWSRQAPNGMLRVSFHNYIPKARQIWR